MLEFKNLRKSYDSLHGKRQVLKDVGFTVNKQDFISIVGSNGAGKSTLVKILIGDETADAGQILMNGVDILSLKSHKRKGMIAKVYQDPAKGTAGEMTILENMALADAKGTSFLFGFCVNKKRVSYYKELLESLNLGLENALDKKAKTLSGGQRQALALIMATMKAPEMLVLDEHTSALDPVTAEIVMEKTKEVVTRLGIPTIMITHNLDHARDYATRVIRLKDGQLVDDVALNEKTIDIYQLFKSA